MFAMSTKIASLLSFAFVQPFATAWVVALFKIHERADAKRIYARTLTYYVLVGTMLSLALGLAAPQLVHVLGRDSFPLSVGIITAMALCYVMSGLMHPLILGPYLQERTTAVLPPFVLSTVLIIGLGIPFTYLWGAAGTTLALLVVYVVQSAALGWISQRLYPIAYEWRRIAKLVVAAAIAFATAHVVFRDVTGSAGWLAPALYVALLLGLLSMLRFPERDEVQALWAAVKSRRGGERSPWIGSGTASRRRSVETGTGGGARRLQRPHRSWTWWLRLLRQRSQPDREYERRGGARRAPRRDLLPG